MLIQNLRPAFSGGSLLFASPCTASDLELAVDYLQSGVQPACHHGYAQRSRLATGPRVRADRIRLPGSAVEPNLGSDPSTPAACMLYVGSCMGQPGCLTRPTRPGHMDIIGSIQNERKETQTISRSPRLAGKHL